MIGRRALLAAGALLPAAAQAQRFHETGSKQRIVRFAGAAGVTLEGTLTLPFRSELEYVPGVVLIAGSGPTDRDGNNSYAPGRIGLLSQLAHIVAEAGIASLRYDKRGVGASTPRPRGSLVEQERFFAWAHFVGDVQAAHAELLRHDEIKGFTTGLVGHSEGGLLAIAAARAMGAKRPHALGLLATPGRPLRDIVRSQMTRNAPAFLAEAERVMAAIAASGRVPGGLSPDLRPVFPAYAGPFLRDALAFDPAAELARLDNPCLMLQGAADKQVVAMDDVQPLFDALAQRAVSGEALVAPGTSHNFKAVSSPFDHGFGGPVVPVIAAKLAGWLAAVLGA